MTEDSHPMQMRIGSATVTGPLVGCWRRRYLRYADGTEDRGTRVIWLQTASGCGDMRIPAGRPDLRARRGLEECTVEELLALGEQDCFCARTRFDAHAQPCPTASWPPEDYLFRFQPPITFPEPGWLEWREDDCMIERAPSGSYEEDWRRAPGSEAFALHALRTDIPERNGLYVVGDHAMYARDRSADLPCRMLTDIAREADNDPALLRRLVDCEFSYAQRDPASGDYRIVLSTLPWLEGRLLGCGDLVAGLTGGAAPAAAGAPLHLHGAEWTVQSLWIRPSSGS